MQSLRQGLIGAWCPSLGATGYTLLDRSRFNNHGTLTNMGGQQSWLASGSGMAIAFDGTDDRVQTAAVIRPLTLTISLWAKIDYASSKTYGRLIEHGLNNSVTVTLNKVLAANQVSFQLASSATVAAWTQGVTSSWEMYTVSILNDGSSGNAWSLYRNGVFDKSGTFSVASPSGSKVWYIGGCDPSAASVASHAGQIDDVRIYNRVLTPSEILMLSSRRGIGLVTQASRVKALPRKFWVNVGGTWRNADSYVNAGGAWKLAVPSVNVGGTWK